MEQKKILATLAVVGTLCATYNMATSNNMHKSTEKKVTKLNNKLLVKNSSKNSDSNSIDNQNKVDVSNLDTTGKINTSSDTVHVRNTPKDSSMILGKLKNTSTVHITGKSNDWYKIKYNGGHGFVHSSAITLHQNDDSSKKTPKPVSFLATSKTGTVYNLYQGISLHVRSGAGLTYSIIGDLHNGDTVNIINQIGNWYEINYNGQIAYVYASYINTNSTSNNNSSNGSIPTPTSTGTVCNLSNGVYLHVRTGPSLDNSIIAYLSEGDTVNIIKEVNGWYEIEYNGQIAYVYGAYVNPNNNNNSIPATKYTGTVCNLNPGVVLHVRSGAGLNYSIIADLTEGATVDIIKEVNGLTIIILFLLLNIQEPFVI